MPCRGGHPLPNFKETVICLLFKRRFLDPATLNNYHAVFKFYFWRRLLKRWWGSIAAPSRKQIFFWEPFQPGIRSRHGTKIVLVTRVSELCQDGEEVIYPSCPTRLLNRKHSFWRYYEGCRHCFILALVLHYQAIPVRGYRGGGEVGWIKLGLFHLSLEHGTVGTGHLVVWSKVTFNWLSWRQVEILTQISEHYWDKTLLACLIFLFILTLS